MTYPRRYHRRQQNARQRRLENARERLQREQARVQRDSQALEQAVLELGLPAGVAEDIQWRLFARWAAGEGARLADSGGWGVARQSAVARRPLGSAHRHQPQRWPGDRGHRRGPRPGARLSAVPGNDHCRTGLDPGLEAAERD
jgi:hypothetical protein